MGVLATPALAASSFTIGNVTPSLSMQLPTGYVGTAAATVEIKNTGDTAGNPKCDWSSATGSTSTPDTSNKFQVSACPSSIAAGESASISVTIPAGLPALATGYYYLRLGLDGGTPTTALFVQVKDPVLASVSIQDSSSNEVATAPDGQPLTASPASGSYPYASSLTYQWYCGDTAIPDATKASYTPAATDVSCSPGIMVKATAGAGAPGAITRQSDPVKIVIGDKLSFVSSPDRDWRLVQGYTADQAKRVFQLQNTGTAAINASSITCKFSTSSNRPMDGDAVVATNGTSIAPQGTIDVTVTPKLGYATGPIQDGDVKCTTTNFGSADLYTSITVQDKASLGDVAISNASRYAPKGLNSSSGLYDVPLAQVGDDVEASVDLSTVFPDDAVVSWQWYCGDKALGEGSIEIDGYPPTSTSTLSVVPGNIGCALSVQASITVNGTAVTAKSDPMKVVNLSLIPASSNYPGYTSLSWTNSRALFKGYVVDESVQPETLVLTNWGDSAVSGVTCALPSNPNFTVSNPPASPLAAKAATAIQLKPVANLAANADQDTNYQQAVTCTDAADGIQWSNNATVHVANNLEINYVQISPEAQVGTTVQASVSTTPTGADLTYKWVCRNGDTSTPALNNTSQASYVIDTKDIGCNLGVDVTATKSGLTDASDSATAGVVQTVSYSGLEYWSVPVGYAAADLSPAQTQITFKNNGTVDLTGVTFKCDPGSSTDDALTCTLPQQFTLAAGQSLTVTVVPKVGMDAGYYNRTVSATYTEKGQPVTVTTSVSLGVDPPAPFDWIQPTDGVKTTPSTPATPGGTNTTPTTPGGTDTAPGGSATPPATAGGTNATPPAPGGSSTAKAGTVAAPSANGTTAKKVDTGGTASHDSTGLALLGLGFIAIGVVILKRRTA